MKKSNIFLLISLILVSLPYSQTNKIFRAISKTVPDSLQCTINGIAIVDENTGQYLPLSNNVEVGIPVIRITSDSIELKPLGLNGKDIFLGKIYPIGEISFGQMDKKLGDDYRFSVDIKTPKNNDLLITILYIGRKMNNGSFLPTTEKQKSSVSIAFYNSEKTKNISPPIVGKIMSD